MQADGKILLGGHTFSDSYYDFALARYNTDGSLDTSFDGDGRLTTNFGASSVNDGYSVTVQADGKILLGGFSRSSGSNDNFALARYNTDGSLDTSFSGDGKVTTDFGSYARGQSVTVQSDGKILLGGYSGLYSPNNFALARYNINGSLDTSFDGDGKLTTSFGAYSGGHSVAMQADGKILLGGSIGSYGSQDFALVRYNTDGSLDTTFAPCSLDATPSFTEGGSAVILDSTVAIFDAELSASSYSGATVTLARHGGASPYDVFSASGNLGAFTVGSVLSLSGTIIGTVTQNSAGSLALQFGGNATQARINEALSSIGYANTSDVPPASVVIDWTFNDGNTGVQGTGGALSTTGSITVRLISVNDAPTGSNGTATIIENSTYTLRASDFGFVDAEDGTTLTAVRIDSLPATGSLRYDGALMSAGLVMTATELAAGHLTFTPASNISGANYAHFSFSVKDSNGAYDLSANTLTFDVAPLVVNGTSGDDTLTGTSYSETLLGLAGNDSLTGGAGDDYVDGGLGTDTALYSANLTNYTLTRSGNTYSVHANSGSDGTDTVTNVESLKFTDMTVNLTIQAKAAAAPQANVQSLTELYVAFFNRVPDADGLAYWIDQMSAGQSISQIAESFYNAGIQYSSLTHFSAGMSNDDFINVVYRNVLGRSDGADAGGLAYWRGKLLDGSATHGSLVSDILYAAHGYKNDPLWHQVPDLLDNKIAVARTFAIDWGLNYNTADASITHGMALAATVTSTSTDAAIALIGVTGSDIQLG